MNGKNVRAARRWSAWALLGAALLTALSAMFSPGLELYQTFFISFIAGAMAVRAVYDIRDTAAPKE